MRPVLALLLIACAAPVRDVRLDCPGSTVRAVPVSPLHAATSRPALACDAGDGWRLADVEGDAALVTWREEHYSEFAYPGPAPRVGQSVCGVVGWSHRWTCARVVREGPGWVEADLGAIHGDSGSGIYRDGRLIGVAIAASRTATRVALTGRLTTGLPQVSLEGEWP